MLGKHSTPEPHAQHSNRIFGTDLNLSVLVLTLRRFTFSPNLRELRAKGDSYQSPHLLQDAHLELQAVKHLNHSLHITKKLMGGHDLLGILMGVVLF